MTPNTLSPLNTYIKLPIELAYATPDRLRKADEDRPAIGEPQGLESWLQHFENQLPDRRIRIQIRAYPADPSASSEIYLDHKALRDCLKQATQALSDKVPGRKRGFFEGVFLLKREGNAISCQTRIVPRVLTGPGVRLMNRLNLSREQEEASRILREFWRARLPWLRRSGIQVLEIRSNLNHLLWH